MFRQIRLLVLIPHTITKRSQRPEKFGQERKILSTQFTHRFLITHTQAHCRVSKAENVFTEEAERLEL